MKIFSFFILFIALLANCFGAEWGSVILINENESALQIEDCLQFQLLTNGNGLVNTEPVFAAFPNNQVILDTWDFSDQTQYFSIYVRNISKSQLDYRPCTHEIIPYDHKQPLKIFYIWDNGNDCHWKT